MERGLITIGMKVTVKGVAGLFEVEKINPKTIIVNGAEDANQWESYKCSPQLLTPAAGQIDTTSEQYRRLVEEAEQEKRFSKGVVVRAKAGKFSGKLDAPHVITDVRDGKLQLFPLGGSPDGRYYRGVPWQNFDVVDVDELMGLSLV